MLAALCTTLLLAASPTAAVPRAAQGLGPVADAVVRILSTTICGTDLHILHGEVPTVLPGRILGHEGVGVIEEVGSSVTSFRGGIT